MYLEGNHVEIMSKPLKKFKGSKVKYLLERDIDKSGRGFYSPNVGTITHVEKKHVDFGNGDYIHFSAIREIILIN